VEGSGQTLTPGSGDNDAATPEEIGSGQYSSASCIAAFDVVPDQTYGATFKIGVVAFHIHEDGIEKVSFQANGGDIVEVSTASLNSTSGVVEHWVELAVAADDGEVNVQAIVYPYTGTTKVLTLRLYSNDDDTYPAAVRYVASDGPKGDESGDSAVNAMGPDITAAIWDMQSGNVIPAGAEIICAVAGEYEITGAAFPSSQMSHSGPWLIVKPDTGLDSSDITVAAATDSPVLGSLTRLAFHNVTLDVADNSPASSSAPGASMWLHNCIFDGTDRTLPPAGFGTGSGYAVYSTSTTFNEITRPAGWMRGCTITGTSEGGPWTSEFVVNTTIADVTQEGGSHPDLWRSTAGMTNVILYGFTCPNDAGCAESQGIVFFSAVGVGEPLFDYQDIAVIECDITAGGGVGGAFGMGGDYYNFYMKDCTFRGTSSDDNEDVAANVYGVFENVNFYSEAETPMDPQPSYLNVVIR
jgi:hypothetical protein